MKKIVALLLALVMVVGLAACGGGNNQPQPSNTPAPSQSTPADNTPSDNNNGPALSADGRYPAETVKIGFVNYDTTAQQTLTLQEYFKYLQTAFNFEIIWSESLDSAEGEFAFIEQCAAAGCQAIIGYYNEGHEESQKLAASLGMYYWGQGADENLQAACKNDPMYLGSFYVGNADYEYGRGCVDALVKADCHKIIVVYGGKDMGVPMFVDRYNGVIDAVADYQAQGYDIEIVYEVPGWPGTEEFTAHQDRALATDADGMVSLLTALMWIAPMQNTGKFGQIKVAAVETLTADLVGLYGAGMYVGCTSEIPDVFGMAIPMILNAVTGHNDQQRNADGTAALIDAGWWLVTSIDEAGFYANIDSNEGGWVFNIDDIKSVLVDYNPDVSVESMCALFSATTAEEIMARHGG